MDDLDFISDFDPLSWEVNETPIDLRLDDLFGDDSSIPPKSSEREKAERQKQELMKVCRTVTIVKTPCIKLPTDWALSAKTLYPFK